MGLLCCSLTRRVGCEHLYPNWPSSPLQEWRVGAMTHGHRHTAPYCNLFAALAVASGP